MQDFEEIVAERMEIASRIFEALGVSRDGTVFEGDSELMRKSCAVIGIVGSVVLCSVDDDDFEEWIKTLRRSRANMTSQGHVTFHEAN